MGIGSGFGLQYYQSFFIILRKIFIQIFGMGIYDYFQKQRMAEAAKRLKEQNISVAEVGYGVKNFTENINFLKRRKIPVRFS